MKDETISCYFQAARRLLDESPLYLLTKQLGVFRELTSIVAQIVALASLTSRNSWPILALTALTPVFDRLINLIPYKYKGLGYSTKFFADMTDHWYHDASYAEHMINYRKSVVNRLARDVSARPELMIFGAKDWIVEQYALLTDLVSALKERGRLHVKRREPPFFHRHIVPLLHSGSRAALYLLVAFQPDYFGMPISQLTFLESSVEGVFQTINRLRVLLAGKLIKDFFRIRNLFECLEIKSQVNGPENPAEYVSNPRGMKLEVRDMSFRYCEESPPVLKNINFTVEPGQIVSIVGYNGSGKTTLIRLLTMFEKPTSGDIYINDIPMSRYDPKVLRAHMSTLFQDFRISVKFNY